MDLCLYGLSHGLPAATLTDATGLSIEQVENVYRDIGAKRRATRYLHEPPLLVREVVEVA
jgi:NAD+ synthase